MTMLFIALGGVCCTSFAAHAACGAAARYGLKVRFASPFCITSMIAATLFQIAVCLRNPTSAAVTLVVAIAAATVCALTDAQTGYIFDAVTLPALTIVLGLSAAFNGFMPSVLGACAAAGMLAALYIATLGRGLGLGDIKLSACIGAALGATDAVFSLGMAFVLGGTYASFMLATGRARRGQTVHFAPYIAGGMALLVLHRMWS